MRALCGRVVEHADDPVHDVDWVAPYWAPKLAKVVQIGTHIFYRWPGVWGRPPAFNGGYALIEPTVVKMSDRWTTVEIPEPAIADVPLDLTQVDIGPVAVSTPEPAAPAIAIKPLSVERIETAPAPPSLAEQAATRTVRATTAPIADPLANPATVQTRQRQRTPMPSRW